MWLWTATEELFRLSQILLAFGHYGFGKLVPTVLASKGYSVVTSFAYTSLTFIGHPVGRPVPPHTPSTTALAVWDSGGTAHPSTRAGTGRRPIHETM